MGCRHSWICSGPRRNVGSLGTPFAPGIWNGGENSGLGVGNGTTCLVSGGSPGRERGRPLLFLSSSRRLEERGDRLEVEGCMKEGQNKKGLRGRVGEKRPIDEKHPVAVGLLRPWSSAQGRRFLRAAQQPGVCKPPSWPRPRRQPPRRPGRPRGGAARGGDTRRTRERLRGGGVGPGAAGRGRGRDRAGQVGCRTEAGRVADRGCGVAAGKARRPAVAGEKGRGFRKGPERDLGDPAAPAHSGSSAFSLGCSAGLSVRTRGQRRPRAWELPPRGSGGLQVQGLGAKDRTGQKRRVNSVTWVWAKAF